MLIETDITYIPTNNGMTYLMCINDVFSKEWYDYNYNTSCTSRDAISTVGNSIIRKFNGKVPDNITLRMGNGPQYISRKFNEYLKLLGSNMNTLKRKHLRKTLILKVSAIQVEQIISGSMKSIISMKEK